jgi:Uma2 family endonuclease
MQVQDPPRLYAPSEYLEQEEASECRHEYRDGAILEMTGGSRYHNRISLNLSICLNQGLKTQDYEVFMADMRLWIPRYRQYTYPDVMVIAGEPIFQEKRTDTVINPLLIVEVLSKSTSDHDRGNKFAYYRSIPEMREYVLVDQYTCHVEQFSKNAAGQWLLTEYESLENSLNLSAIDFQLSLQEIYDRVELAASEA